ncbi:uncharacterized protein OCT59_008730 [Rhizophagus irregularis]|uniref:uncharacterized protein n=1 Tax=Rhizophagus irregularis TaxID=588596 RepID=UPI00332E69A4|nr:hypothetical protein OCT59_008730 [Rhizophagus irregularis]
MLRNQQEEAVNNFNNDPKIKVLLISLKCGSLGLNLTTANQCFLIDPWWNPSIEDQAIDQIYRIGQIRAFESNESPNIDEALQVLLGDS